MDFKEKYQEALERAKKGLPIDEVFPELKGSEDERIRKELIQLLLKMTDGIVENYTPIPLRDFVAYLEKQKENPKSADSIPSNYVSDAKWADTIITRAIVALSDDVDYNKDESCKYRREIDDLKKLREEIEKQKEQQPVPKFSVGDYVIDANYKGEPLYQIVGIDKECYICEYRGDKNMGDRAVMHFTFDNPYLRLEQKPAEKITDAEIEQAMDEVTKFKVFAADLAKTFGITHLRDIDWHNFCAGLLTYLELNRPAEWSEEDKQVLQFSIDWLNTYRDRHVISQEAKDEITFCIEKLKSLCPQPHWKPSEEQMEALMLAIEGKCLPTSYMSRRLEDLYEGLANTYKVEYKLEN